MFWYDWSCFFYVSFKGTRAETVCDCEEIKNMNRWLLGMLVGAVLGLVDGATAWFTPAVRPYIESILIGSTGKGLLVGVASAAVARKLNSIGMAVAFASIIGLILAYIVAAMPSATGEHYYLEIMLPGFVLGGLIGFLTQRYGK
jgi:hypothetical protein